MSSDWFRKIRGKDIFIENEKVEDRTFLTKQSAKENLWMLNFELYTTFNQLVRVVSLQI